MYDVNSCSNVAAMRADYNGLGVDGLGFVGSAGDGLPVGALISTKDNEDSVGHLISEGLRVALDCAKLEYMLRAE